MSGSLSAKSIVEPDPTPSSSDVIVFVGGCDRSGTTLASRLIAEQLSLVVLPEAYFHAVAYRRLGADATATQALRHWRRRSWDLSADDPLAEGKRLAPYLRARMSDIYASRRGPPSPLRVVECTPENIEIGSILLAEFPDARLVHLVRDPRAVVASLRAADFGPTSAQECARLWKQRVASGLGLEIVRGDRVIRVRFEDLVADPAAAQTIAKSVPGDGDFEWDADRDLMLDPTSRSLQARVPHPVDPGRVDSWRSMLSVEEIGTIEYECRELMLAFGYELDGQQDLRSSTRRRLDSTRSVVGELTTGSLRRFVRVNRARIGQRTESGQSQPVAERQPVADIHPGQRLDLDGVGGMEILHVTQRNWSRVAVAKQDGRNLFIKQFVDRIGVPHRLGYDGDRRTIGELEEEVIPGLNVVPVVGRCDELLLTVSPFIEMTTIDSIVRVRPHHREPAARVGMTLAEILRSRALDDTSGQVAVWKGLDPKNIGWSTDGRLWLFDFGPPLVISSDAAASRVLAAGLLSRWVARPGLHLLRPEPVIVRGVCEPLVPFTTLASVEGVLEAHRELRIREPQRTGLAALATRLGLKSVGRLHWDAAHREARRLFESR